MFCHRVQEFLAQKGVSFEEKDITKDEKYVDELDEMGYASTPVTIIDGEVVLGFDRRRLEELLKE
jgi:glutaredoxin